MWLEKSPLRRNFVLWGHLKCPIYETPVETEKAVALAACANHAEQSRDLHGVRQNMMRRHNACSEFGVLNFEQILWIN
jgi:hypothetical protein